QDSLWFLLPMMGVVVAFGIAIPNVLSQALLTYREVAGSAGALFGLAYYLLLSLGLALAAGLQDLGMLLIGCGLLAVRCSGRRPTCDICCRDGGIRCRSRSGSAGAAGNVAAQLLAETSAADKAVADAGFGLDQVGLLGMLPPSFLLKHQLPIKR